MTLLQFKKAHHLLDRPNRILYCYVAKNACSTLKFHFLKKKFSTSGVSMSDEDINSQLHPLSRNLAITQIPGNYFADTYAFFIVRHPFSRLASAYLEKFVQSDQIPEYALRLMKDADLSDDAQTWTFSDFVRAVASVPVETLNEHWMPQYLHAIAGVKYDFIPMESFSTHAPLERLYGNLSRNVRSHSLNYSDEGEPAHRKTIKELKQMNDARNIVPPWQSLVQPEIEEDILRTFGPDLELYERAIAAGERFIKTEPGATVDKTAGTSQDSRHIGGADRAETKGLISVVLPVYNVEKYVAECLESLAAQDDENFELLVIDDGAIDSSIPIVEGYAPRFRKIRIHRQKNRGLGAARNTGIRLAKGEFITFVDSDDVITPNYLSLLRRKQEAGNYEVVTGMVAMMSEDGTRLPSPNDTPTLPLVPPAAQHELVLGGQILSVACSRLYRKDLLLRHGLEFHEGIPHEDLFFTYKVLRFARSTAQLPEYIYSWRQRPGSISKSITSAHIKMLPRLMRDTAEFLSDLSANPYELAFAARRNLQLLRRFRQKIDQFDSAKLDEYLAMVRDQRDVILGDIQRLENSKIGERTIVKTAHEILNEARSYRRVQSLKRLNGLGTIDFAFFPLRAYHLIDCLPVLDAMRERGLVVEVVETDGFRKGQDEVSQAARRLGIHLAPFSDLIDSAIHLRVAVMWNDWDPLMRLVARACQQAGTATVGWVEGIQDYHDVDQRGNNRRHPYMRSSHVVLPGKFDRRYFTETNQRLHEGEVVRIRSLWDERQNSTSSNKPSKVLINSNFSYGVLEEHRDDWLKAAVDASLASGLKPVISRHPFDKGKLYPELTTRQSFFEAVRECEVSIQRFASGVLEALASGVPVVYFNPHGEKVDKFTSPDGAYLIANNRGELEAILSDKQYFWSEERAFEFLNLHTGLSRHHQPPGHRIDKVLDAILQESAAPTEPLGTQLADLPPPGSFDEMRIRARAVGPLFGPDAASHTADHASSANRAPQDTALIDPESSAPPRATQKPAEDEPDSANSGAKPHSADEEITAEVGPATSTSTINTGAGTATGTSPSHSQNASGLQRDATAPWYKASAVRLRARSGALFRLGQIVNWTLKAAWHHKTSTAVLLVACAGLFLLPLIHQPLSVWRLPLWSAAGILAFGAIAGAVLEEIFRRLTAAQRAAVSRAVNEERLVTKRRTEELEDRIVAQQEVERNLRSELQKHVEEEVARLSRFIATGDESLRSDFETKVADVEREIMQTITKKSSQLEENFAADLSRKSAEVKAEAKAGDEAQLADYQRLDQGLDRRIYTLLGEENAVLGKALRIELQQNSDAAASQLSEVVDSQQRLEKALETRLLKITDKQKADLKALSESVKIRTAEITETAKVGDNATLSKLEKLVASKIDDLDTGVERKLAKGVAKMKGEISAVDRELRLEISKAGEIADELQSKVIESRQKISKTIKTMGLVRESVAAGNRQIGALRYPKSPDCIVYFGHHKCGSRFFRNEVFPAVAEYTGSRIRKYEIDNPPFHYSRMDELDLSNIDFSDIGKAGRDVILFANASRRSLEKVRRSAENWKGIRVLRDPRQVLVSNYFHHKGEHKSEWGGWVWDQLAHDKPILRQMPEEDGLLYELDNITKGVLEEQVLAAFDDDRVLTVKLEDFSTNPKTYLVKMAEFLEVADIAGVELSNTKANDDSGPWEAHFTSRIRDVFKDRYGQSLIDLGYADDLDW